MLDIQEKDGITVVRMKDTDRLNTLITGPVRDKLEELFATPNTCLVFDMGGISFIDSSGFAILLQANKAAANNNGSFKICQVSADVMELFKLLQLHHVFELYQDLDSCVDSFK